MPAVKASVNTPMENFSTLIDALLEEQGMSAEKSNLWCIDSGVYQWHTDSVEFKS